MNMPSPGSEGRERWEDHPGFVDVINVDDSGELRSLVMSSRLAGKVAIVETALTEDGFKGQVVVFDAEEYGFGDSGNKDD
jgi:hypothetical protein